MSEENKLIPFNSPNFAIVKSNDMLSAKYKANLLELRTMTYALGRVEFNHKKDGSLSLEAKLYPGELKKIFSDKKHIYRDLKAVSKSIVGHTMFVEEKQGKFDSFSMVPNASYDEGVLTIKFNEKLADHIFDLEERFARMNRDMLLSLETTASYRIYELLKKDLYQCKQCTDGCYTVSHNLSEFRFIVGLANSDAIEVQKELARTGNKAIDWDHLYDILDKKDKKYPAWGDLQRKVLIPAQKELEEKSDLRFEFKGERKNHRNKIDEIVFKIYRNESAEPIEKNTNKINLTTSHTETAPIREAYYPLYEEYEGHNNLSAEDIDILLKYSGYDPDRVKNAIEYSDKRKGIINDYMGWLIKCITDDYAGNEKTMVIDGDAEKGEHLKEIMDSYEESKKTGEVQRSVWEKIKNREDFSEFEEMLEQNSLSVDHLLIIYSLDEAIQIYYDWRTGREISF